jgi:hypothetical protein
LPPTSIPTTTPLAAPAALLPQRSRNCSSTYGAFVDDGHVTDKHHCARHAQDPRQRQPPPRIVLNEHAGKIEAQLKAEVVEHGVLAEATDRADIPGYACHPDELAWREERLAKIAEAKVKIEARAQRTHREANKAEYAAQPAAREARDRRDGKKSRGQTADATGDAPKDRTTSLTKNRASCRHPVVVLAGLQTHKAARRRCSRVAVSDGGASAQRRGNSADADTPAALTARLGMTGKLLADAGYQPGK